MINKFFLDKAIYGDYNLFNGNTFELNGISKINLFIGQNNSGKSRFLRKLFHDQNFEFELKKGGLQQILKFLKFKYAEIEKIFKAVYMADVDSILVTINKILTDTNKFKNGNVAQIISVIHNFAESLYLKKNFTSWSPLPNYSTTRTPDTEISKLQFIGIEIKNTIDDIFEEGYDFKIDRIYIPILRGLRPLALDQKNDSSQKDNYKERTIKDYFNNSDDFDSTDQIFTGLSLYDETKKLLLGDRAGRDKIKSFEDFLSKNFFNDKDLTLIPDITKDVLLIGIDGEERSVYELGDGIQAIIILLYPLFFNQDKNLLVFIEEPENSMHPGLQRIFLETLLLEEFKNFQFFITTHSNHFLDITMDLDSISIYTFLKKKGSENGKLTYEVENTSNTDIKILDLIGTRNSSIFTSNCTIWVEGITDRLYLKRYLEVYQEYIRKEHGSSISYREDFNFSFVEYGGANLAHWSFTDNDAYEKIRSNRISQKIYVIADKDGTNENFTDAKSERFRLLSQNLKENFKVINAREIENTLSEKILIKTVKKMEGTNGNSLKYNDQKVIFKEYQNEKLGSFIDLNFENLKRKYSAKSGTINSKLDFCKFAIDQIETFEDLSEEGIVIIKEIYDFIKRSN